MKLETRNLFFSYGEKKLLTGVNLTLEPGKFTLLLGPNGCGKSTLLRLLTGELSPDRGEILLDGRPVRSYPGRERARRIGAVLQSAPPALDYSVSEYVLTGRNARMSPFAAPNSADLAALAASMRYFQVETLAERPCGALSGGERQRVMLAAAWAGETEILLLDEPTSATDPAHTFAILEILRARAAHKTVFMITHDLTLAGYCADRILLLKDGMIFADGTPEEVLTPDHLFEVYDLRVSVIRADNGALAILPLGNLRGDSR